MPFSGILTNLTAKIALFFDSCKKFVQKKLITHGKHGKHGNKPRLRRSSAFRQRFFSFFGELCEKRRFLVAKRRKLVAFFGEDIWSYREKAVILHSRSARGLHGLTKNNKHNIN